MVALRPSTIAGESGDGQAWVCVRRPAMRQQHVRSLRNLSIHPSICLSIHPSIHPSTAPAFALEGDFALEGELLVCTSGGLATGSTTWLV